MTLKKSNSIIAQHRSNHDSNRTSDWYASNGFLGGMTTIRPKTTRKVHHIRFEGGLTRCSIYDLSNNKILSDESVINGETYELKYYQGVYILEESQKLILASSDILKEIKSLKIQLEELNPKSFPRFYVWTTGPRTAKIYEPLIFNEIEYNDGEMYDAESGKATAKYDGLYLFSTSLYKSCKSNYVCFKIFINNYPYAESCT